MIPYGLCFYLRENLAHPFRNVVLYFYYTEKISMGLYLEIHRPAK